MSLLGIEVRLEDQATTRHIHVLAHHPFQLCLQHVRIVNIALDIADIVDGTHVHIGEHTTDFLVRMEDDALIAGLGLTGHTVFGNGIDNDHDGSEHDQQHPHDPQAQSVCKRSFLHNTSAKLSFIFENKEYFDRKNKKISKTKENLYFSWCSPYFFVPLQQDSKSIVYT